MDWLQVSVFTTAEGIEPVSGRLMQLGITGMEIEDESDFRTFLEENRAAWDYVDEDLIKQKESETCVKVYIQEDDPDMLAAIKTSMLELKEYDKNGLFGRLAVDTGSIREEDWANTWKKYFHTMEIGEKLVIKPYWEDIEVTDKKVFEINPGLTFGTGSHHTTRMCLEDIEGTIKEGDEVLDLGCGSGILSLVSLMFGAKYALAVDIDANSMETAYDNLERNNLPREAYTVLIGNVLSDDSLRSKISEKKYDVVLANIVADVIIALLPLVKLVLKPDSVFITSGIIDERICDVKEALLNYGFEIIKESRSDDWAEFKCRLG